MEYFEFILGYFLIFLAALIIGCITYYFDYRRRCKLFYLTVYFVMLLTNYVPPNAQPALLRHCPSFSFLDKAFTVYQYFLGLSSSCFTNPMKEFLSCKHIFYVTDRDIKKLHEKLHLSMEDD